MKNHNSFLGLAIECLGAIRGLPILAMATSFFALTDSAHAVPTPYTDTYAAIYFPITNPLCTPACMFSPTFSHVADDSRLALGSAGYGSVGAEVSIHDNAFTGSPRFLAEAQGSMLDNIALSGPFGTGSISFNVGLHGTAFTTIPGIVDPNIQFFFSASGPNGASRIDVHSAVDGFPSQTFTTSPFDYKFGDPITLNMGLLAAVLQHANGDGSPLVANVLYHNTATITGLTVFDALGAPVSNFSISSQSGTIYPLASAVPEPSIAWLLAGGGCLLFTFRRRLAEQGSLRT